MVATTAIPVVVTPKAAERIAELGLEADVRAMIKHIAETVVQLCSIQVDHFDDPEEPQVPRIRLTAWRSCPDADNSVWDHWTDWFVRTFPGNVRRYVGFDAFCRDSDAG
jgi:hypothetical protein